MIVTAKPAANRQRSAVSKKNTPAKKVQTVSRPTANYVNRSGAANNVVRPGAVMRTSSDVKKEKVSAANADPGQSGLKRPVSISR